MATFKRISGNYTIASIGTTDNVSVNTHTLTVNGNLVVTGNTTTIQSNNISTFDPTISVNGNLTTSSSPFSGNSGLEVVRGIQPTAALYWNETVKAWQITSNIGNYATYANIATSSSASGVVDSGTATRLAYYATTGTTVSDTTANLTWTGNSVLAVVGNVKTTSVLVDSRMYLKTTSSSVASLSGNIVVAAANARQGGTGLYVNNTTATDELVSKTKARKFAILFG